MQLDNLNDFQRAYVKCALWTSNEYSKDADGLDCPHNFLDQDYGVMDIDQKTIEQMVKDCNEFYQANAQDIILVCDNHATDYNRGNAGHDFWLTRNGYGAGFFDRGLGAVGHRLMVSAQRFKEVSLYVGDDGRIHAEVTKSLKTGFVLDMAYCEQCDFVQRRDGVWLTPFALKEDIINRIRREHNANCENGLVIVIDNCYYG